jgi:alanyl-tRNA synthetase
MESSPINSPKKDYCRPMHTAEHILNQTMIRMFGCIRSKNAHIEAKKSKCDYFLKEAPTAEQMQEVENKINEIIKKNLPVSAEFMDRNKAATIVDLSKLPQEAGQTLRIVKIGDYDICACIGMHVDSTKELGEFKFISYDFNEGKLRVRFKLINNMK